MRKVNILDVHYLYTFLGQYIEHPDLLMIARNIAVDPSYTGYIEDGICIIFEDLGNGICRLHAYCDKEQRGKTFMNFLMSLESELKGKYTEVLMEPPSLPHIHRLIKYMGVPEIEPGVYSYKIKQEKS